MKHIYNLFNKTLIILAALAISGNVWGGTAKYTLNAQSSSSNGGYVMVSDNANATFSGTSTNASKTSSGSTGITGLSKKNFTLYAYASKKNGCVFKGWSTSTSTDDITSTATKMSASSGNLYYSQTKSDTYYALFARLAGSTASGSTIDLGEVTVGENGTTTLTIYAEHTGNVTLSKTGHTSDFVIKDNGSEISSFTSKTEMTKALTIEFNPTNNGVRTCTLTISCADLSSLTYTLTGVGYNNPSVAWVDGDGNELTSGETTLSAGDVLRATCTTGQTISYSGYNATYFTAGTDGSGNPILTVREDITGTTNNLSVTANLAKNTSSYYAAYSENFMLNVTNLVPQTIVWTDDITDLSNENMPYNITLTAVAKNAKTGANSGQAITYSMPANDYLTLSGNTLTVRAIGGPVQMIATAAGNASYASASVKKYVTVINMTDPCGTSDSHSNGSFNRGGTHDIYPTTPQKLTFTATRSSSWLSKNLVVTEYNAAGTVLATTTKDYGDISTSGTSISINCNPATTHIRFAASSSATYTYTISNIKTTRLTTSSVSKTSLSYETDPGQSLGKTLDVTYSNIPVFLTFKSDEDAGGSTGHSLWSLSTHKFGGCGKRGTQTVTVTFHSNAKGSYSDKLYVRNNVGDLLHTINLTASVTPQEQFLDTWNIKDTYNTNESQTLAASTTVGNTNFTFTVKSSTPADIVNISQAGVISFNNSGTAVIRAYQPGDDLSAEFEATHNITINKVTPTLTPPTIATGLVYNPNEKVEDHWTGGSAKDDKNNPVAGTYHCTEILQPAKNATGYTVTFKPTNTNWYTENTAVIKQNVAKADQIINWALANGTECQTGTSLAGATATSGQTVTYISGNTNIATVDANNKLVVVVANQDVQITARQVGDANWNSVDSVRTIHTIGAQPNDMSGVSATNLTYGQPLQASTISGSVKLNGVIIPGSLAWTDPTIVPEVGDNQPFEVTFTPDNQNAYAVTRFNVNINVAKATPVLTWHIGNAIREKSTYRIPVSSSNTETQLNVEVIAGSSIASWTENGLVIGALTGNATSTTIKLRITQDGNNNYNAITPVEKTITVEKKYSVCVPVVFDKDSYSNAAASTDGNVGWCDTNENGSAKFWNMFNVTYTQHKGIYLGGWDEGLSLSFGSNFNIHYTEKYVVLSINGVPDRIKFTTVAQTVTAIGIDFPQTSPKWRIEESSNGTNWTSIYEGTAQEFTADQELVHSTRYVKVTYGGNFTGFLKDIEITRQHYLRADKSSLTFGTAEHPLQTPQELTLSYSSIGSCENPQGYIDLEIDNPAFYVDEQRITQNVNFDQYDSYKVYVRCTDINQTGTLSITGSDGTTTSVALSSENIEITPANASTNLIYTGTEHAALNNTPYRGMQPLHFTNCFDNGTALFDSLYIYGVTDNINQTVATVQGNDYKIPTFTVTNGTTTGTAHTPCYVYAKNGNKYTYTRSFDAANTAQEIDAPAEKLWFGGYKPAAITNAAVRVSGNGGTRTDLYLDNVDMNNGEAVILAQNNSGAEAFTLALHAEGTNKIASNAAAAMQIGAAKGQIVIEDSWCNATSAMLTLNPASGKPSIELGSAQNAVVVNGTQLSLKNGNPLAIAYTRNGVEQTIGSVIINDGTIIGETELHFPEATRIYGGTFNDGQVRAYTAQGLTYPTNDVGERLLRKSMDKASLPPYYGQAHLTLDNILKVNPILKDEHIYVFNEDGDWDDSDNWDVDEVPGFNADVIINSNVNVVGDITVNNITIAENKDVTVVDGASLTINGTTGNSAPFGNIIVEAGGQLILGNGAVNVNDFTLYSGFDGNQQPKSGQVSGQDKLSAHGHAYFILDLDPAGAVANEGWYTFTVPFPVDELRGIERLDNGNWTTIVNEKDYAVMAYNEARRAQTGKGWKKYTGILQPGVGYTLGVDPGSNTYRFTKTDNGAFNTNMVYELQASEEGESVDIGWNSLGNGTMGYVTLDEKPLVQIYDHESNTYTGFNSESITFAVGAAYFVQKPENLDALNLTSEINGTIRRAPQRNEMADNERFGLSLTTNGKLCDNLFVTCDDEATSAYTCGKDVQKMGNVTGTKVARLWTNAKGTNLCAIYTAYSNDQAIIPLNIYAPKAGEYTLSLENSPVEDVYLTRNGIIVWNLTMSDYTFELNAGSDTSYALQVVRRVQNTATGVDAIDNDKRGTDFVEKMIVNGQLFILRDGILYDAQGKKVSNL